MWSWMVFGFSNGTLGGIGTVTVIPVSNYARKSIIGIKTYQ
jgi:hypothetical protein